MNPPPKSDLAKSFDVFLCHNSLDKPVIRAIASQLKNHGISYWTKLRYRQQVFKVEPLR